MAMQAAAGVVEAEVPAHADLLHPPIGCPPPEHVVAEEVAVSPVAVPEGMALPVLPVPVLVVRAQIAI